MNFCTKFYSLDFHLYIMLCATRDPYHDGTPTTIGHLPRWDTYHDETPTTRDTYHDGIAGAGGEVDVVMVGGDASVPLLDVAGHVPSDAFDTLAGTVGT